MNLTFTTTPGLPTQLPIELLFWAMVAIYVVHILEESVLGEIFVDKLRAHFYPAYTWTKFFGFNTLLMTLNITAIFLYDGLGGRWIIFPLAMATERTLNGFWHLGETLLTRRFSSGLLTSVLTWNVAYFIIRYAILKGQIPAGEYLPALLIGAALTAFMLGSQFIMKALYMKKPAKS